MSISSKSRVKYGRTNLPSSGPRTKRRSDAARPEAGSGAGSGSGSNVELVSPSLGFRATVAAHGGAYRWVMGWFLSACAAWFHLVVTNLVSASVSAADPSIAAFVIFGVMFIPAVVTAVKVPSARFGVWRWFVLYSILAFTWGGGSAMAVLVFGETALLHRFWVSERVFGFGWAPTHGSCVPAARRLTMRGLR